MTTTTHIQCKKLQFKENSLLKNYFFSCPTETIANFFSKKKASQQPSLKLIKYFQNYLFIIIATKKLLFLSEYLKASFLQPHIWKYNVFSSGADGLLSDKAKEMGLQRDQTESKCFPSSWRADLCTFTLKYTAQNFAILSLTHVLEASRLPCEELDLTGAPSSTLTPLGSHTLGIPQKCSP